MSEEKSFFSVAEAARMLNVPPATVYGWIRKKIVPDLNFKKLGGKLIISKANLDKVLGDMGGEIGQ
jgi:excisionase family DNA binding protein